MRDVQFNHSARHAILGALASGLLAAALVGPAAAADVTNERLLNADAETANWIHHHRTYDGHRFSPLNEVNKDNVGQLKIVATVMLGGLEAAGRYPFAQLEGTPLAEDGYLYVTDGWNNIYKIDARSGNRAIIVWKWDPEQDREYASDSGCCQARNRGVAMVNNVVIQSVMDGRMVAVDKDTGELVWEAKTADNDLMESHTGAPLVIGDVAINGVTGAEYGIRGHIDAINVNTGEPVWRTYMIPAPGEPGHETWEDDYDAWMTGGGSVWQAGTFDPEINVTFWGVGNPSPQFDAEYRPGDNLYTESTVALNPDTGEILYHFQYTPNDPYDYDEIGEAQLIDVEIQGEPRKIWTKVARNGFVYGIDRTNGQFLYGKQYVEVANWTNGIDQKTGLPMSYDPNARGVAQLYAPGTAGRRDGRLAVFCPHLGGGKNWQPAAYHRDSGRLFTGALEACSAYKTVVGGVDHWAEKGNKLGTVATRDPAGWRGRDAAPAGTEMPVMDERGSVTAMSPADGETVGKAFTRSRPSGILATAGGLVFTGDQTGDFLAFDAETMEQVWIYNIGTGIAAPPMTYAVDGKQYIAVLAGSEPGGFARKNFPDTTHMAPSNMLYIFSL
jgi:alcohol dehydrogenase (cytochrome c)